MAGRPTLVVACGALARELTAVIEANRLDHLVVEYLPARLHNTPELITDAVLERLDRAGGRYRRVLVGYADCGTGGRLDAALDRRRVERLPGAHCYELFAGSELFSALHDAEPGTFYLTDYLNRHFDRLVWEGLGIADHPQLLDEYFRNYRRLVYLSQLPTPELVESARHAADRLGLEFEHRPVGTGNLADALAALVPEGRSAPDAPAVTA